MANETETKEKVYKYRVRPGFVHGVGDKYKAGDIVELTEEAAFPLLDKLERVRGGETEEEQLLEVNDAPRPAPELVTTEDKGGKKAAK